jgi:hypothetical protein
MADAPWKRFERYVAGMFSSLRNSLSGGNSKLTRSDSTHPKLFISCKYTRHNHKTLRQLLGEERQKAKVEKKTAVLFIGEFDDRANTMVVLALKDLPEFCRMVKNGEVTVAEATVEPSDKRPKRKRAGVVAG